MLLRLPLILATAATFALAASTTLATVNGKAITSKDASAFMAKAIPGMSFDKLDAKMKRQIVDQLINQTLIKDQVKKSGIQNTPQFKVAYAALRDDLAVDMWMKQQMGKISVSEKETKEFYEANKDKMKQANKAVPYEKAKFEITQFIKMEKFKASMGKTTDALRASSKVEIKL
ncbi:MAG TPA: SurA N-terminal domain-containing protein [Sulfuricurvum sp.]|nr:MAG: hypothetical protein B7Y30_09710 [Campylobacterales bacterium 16-40-21]OZA03211.1 MAG: hypothetical protein B7X89_06295 [Sulfuricurvum sp. 17-40-25]HQS66980.1 SurA N-terminal domain-containing protein [Sulfuricurvum sp.]HQT37305.1 SurA N-terminal domain-containing protein [Sulfuricurvum sp.]